MSGQGSLIFGAIFFRRGTLDIVATLPKLLNSTVTERLYNHLRQATKNTRTRNHLSSSFYQQASPAFISYPYGHCQYHTKLSHKASL